MMRSLFNIMVCFNTVLLHVNMTKCKRERRKLIKTSSSNCSQLRKLNGHSHLHNPCIHTFSERTLSFPFFFLKCNGCGNRTIIQKTQTYTCSLTRFQPYDRWTNHLVQHQERGHSIYQVQHPLKNSEPLLLRNC